MKHQRLLELDSIRGLAALAVVLFHYFFRYEQIYGHQSLNVDWAHLGKFGVQLFFMVSGFVIFWTLNRVERPLDFIVSRFSRLYPAFWLAILTTYFIVYIFGLPGREVSFNNALLNMLMFHEYLGIPHVDGVYWTLTVELTFYFWIFIFYSFSGLNKVEDFFAIVVLLSLLHSLELIHIPNIFYELLIMKTIPFFLAGICFYKLTNNYTNQKKTLVILLFSLLSTIAIYSSSLFIVFSGFYLFFYLAVSGHLRVLTFQPLVFLGSISYSLYLIHQNIGYIVINKSYELGLPPLLGISFSIVIVILLSTIMMKYIEKPSLLYLRRVYKNSSRMQRIAEKLALPNNR